MRREIEEKTMNNAERELWIANDENLYSWQRYSGLNKREFIKEYRVQIDAEIDRVINRSSEG
jgi:hypothetical protein